MLIQIGEFYANPSQGSTHTSSHVIVYAQNEQDFYLITLKLFKEKTEFKQVRMLSLMVLKV